MTTTTLCYIENEGKYLMLHRVKKKNDINEGKWIGVGGHVEYQESPEECLVFEDIPAGIQAGKRAGMTVFAVEDEFSRHMREEKAALADYYINDYYEMLDYLKEA